MTFQGFSPPGSMKSSTIRQSSGRAAGCLITPASRILSKKNTCRQMSTTCSPTIPLISGLGTSLLVPGVPSNRWHISPHCLPIRGYPNRLMAMCQDPAFQKLFRAIWKASQENAKYQQVIRQCAQVSLDTGFPPLTGGMAQAPFDTIADSLRGTRGTTMDMYRQPEKLLETLEAIVDRSVETAVKMTNMARSPVVLIPMHKGDVSFMSVKQFERFYWPTFRRLLLGLINEGCVPWMMIDGKYDEPRLKIISDLPRSSVVWNMEQTDMFKAKEILGNSACITGNVTATQLYTYSPQELKSTAVSLSKFAAKAADIYCHWVPVRISGSGQFTCHNRSCSGIWCI